jgi:hypothetical protein
MAVPQASEAGISLSCATQSLGIAPDDFLSCLFKARYLYRYTGVGQPRAYVRWERAGMFVNRPTEVLITQMGLERIREVFDRGPDN